MTGRLGLASLVFLAALASPVLAEGEGARSHNLVLGAGVFGLKSHDQHDIVVDLEWRGRPYPKLFGVYSVGGVAVTDEGGLYGRLGFGRDFSIGENWKIAITTATGAYEKGDGKELGHTLEFRSAFEVSRKVGRFEVGLQISHLSNASISSENPGVEIALVTLRVPLGGDSDGEQSRKE